MAITASAVAGTKARSPRARRPAFSGVAPSTSLAGSISSSTAGASRWAGSGWATTMPEMLRVAIEGADARPPGRRAARHPAARSRSARCRRCAPLAPGWPRRPPTGRARRSARPPGAAVGRQRSSSAGDALRQLAPQARGDHPAVEDLRAHEGSILPLTTARVAASPSAAWRSSRSASGAAVSRSGSSGRQVGEVDADVQDGAADRRAGQLRGHAGIADGVRVADRRDAVGQVEHLGRHLGGPQRDLGGARPWRGPAQRPRVARCCVGFLGQAARRDHRLRRRRRPARPGRSSSVAVRHRVVTQLAQRLLVLGAASGRPMVSSATIATSAAPMAPASAAAEPPPGIGSRLARRAVSSAKERLGEVRWSAYPPGRGLGWRWRRPSSSRRRLYGLDCAAHGRQRLANRPDHDRTSRCPRR